MIKSIKIVGLFGNTEAEIKINCSGVNIYIGENGSGKTTILNILYYTLTCDLYRLKRYEFDKIKINLLDNTTITIEHADIIKYNANVFNKYVLPSGNWPELLNFVSDNKNMPLRDIYRRADRMFPRSWGVSFNMISDIKNFIENGSHDDIIEVKVSNFIDKMRDCMKGFEILFLPTYRRIEEDIERLDIKVISNTYKNSEYNDINFGMNDVKLSIDKIKQEMSSKVQESMRKISSNILTQLIDGEPEVENEFVNEIEEDVIQIILARLGDDINEEYKEKIMELVKNGKLTKKNKFLIYFVTNLIKAYEGQQLLENRIEKYIEIVNKYISSSEKEIVYDKRNIELMITSNRFNESKTLIEFISTMSSGEKQILSIFAKLYLDDIDKKYIVLFDEPELSLSVYWQERLLPDIMNSGKVANLIAITHSPFVYDNKLRDDAMALSDSVIYYKKTI